MFLGGLLTEPALAASYPTRGSALVDGEISEWQLAADYFGDMYHFKGHGSKVLLSRLYLRYDCETETMYLLSLQVSEEYPVSTESGEAWARINKVMVVRDTDNNDGAPPDFAWVGLSASGDTARGWEGSFHLAPGTYVLTAHQNMFEDGEWQTVRTDDAGLELIVFCLPVDFGDAPTKEQSGRSSSYPTRLVDKGAQHVIVAGFCLGAVVDAEADGQPDDGAVYDDEHYYPWDEDGVLFTSKIGGTLGTATVRVTLLNDAGRADPRLDAWIDFNHDGDWDDEGERIFTHQALSPGRQSLTFPVPAAVAFGRTYARFRLSDGGVAGPRGLAASGEVEDWVVRTYPDEAATYSVGNLFFVDDGRGGGIAQNGRREGGEPGIVRAKLELRESPSGVVVAEAATNERGYYRFDYIPAGSYRMFIPPENFLPGAPMYNMLSSPGVGEGNEVDHGIDSGEPAVTGLNSLVFTLGPTPPPPLGDWETGPSGAGRSVGLMYDPPVADNPPEGHFDGGDASDDLTIDFGFYLQPPTGAELGLFGARWVGAGEVLVSWETLVEFDVLGYRVERRQAGGAWTPLSGGLTPAMGSGRSYQVSDGVAASGGVVEYRLLKVDTHGGTEVLAETEVRGLARLEVKQTELGLELSVSGRAGGVLVLETSTDAARGPWEGVQELRLDETGTAVARVAVNAAEPIRFYRLIEE